MTIGVLVADDEALARRRIRRLLEDEPNVVVLGECHDGREAVAAVREQSPDLLFLDVQMPELDGFGVLEELGPERLPAVIFVTAFDHYAIRAFEVHALDYLLKPFDEERFRAAFRRARSHLERERAVRQDARLVALLEQLAADQRVPAHPPAPAEPAYMDRLMIKSGGRIFFVKTAEIDWVEAAGNYVRLHLGRESHLMRETMGRLEAKLNPAQFVRIHRSTIVNLDRIKEMQPWFSGEYLVILRDGTKLKLSRWYHEKLDERMRSPR